MFGIPHRGLTSAGPENSLGALVAAAAAGASHVEVDVRTSADGKWWLLHDAFLDRTTSGRGRLRAADSARLAAVFLADGSRLPRLDEALDAAPPGLTLCLDVKDDDQSVVASARAARGPVEIWSRHGAVVRAATRAGLPASYLCRGIMQAGIGATIWRARDLGATRISLYPADIERHVAAACRNAGMPFMSGTPNDEATWEFLARESAQAVITDRFQEFSRWQSRRGLS